MNQQRIFEHAISDARAIPQPWGRFKTFVRKPSPRSPQVPLALAYANYINDSYQDIDLKEAIRTARALGFQVASHQGLDLES